MSTRQLAQIQSRARRNRRALSQTIVALSAGVALCGPAHAAPAGGQVAAGQASITPQGTTTVVKQNSARAIINWQNFDVAAGETVAFQQPSASAITLNRVAGATSNIAGNINANGRIFIINANGVVFGPSAVVNTAGLVATSANIDDADFMQGHTDFRIAGSDNAQISNQGVINAPGGRVALLAPHVENTGTISANGGVVVLATGQIFLVDLFGDGLIQVATAHQHGAFGDLVHNMGDIRVGTGVALVRSLPQLLQGSVNSVNVTNLANSAVLLPGGTVAFVGASANAVQSSAPTWIGSGVIYVGTTFQGAGVIDATPTYSFQAPGAASALAATATAGAPAGVNRLADVGLTEFNRLTEAPVAHAEREVSGALYTVSAQPRPVRDLRPAAAIDDSPAPARPAQRVQRTAYNKRFCTVTEVMHAASASCR
jgi:filamentous hemagglutinin family protein